MNRKIYNERDAIIYAHDNAVPGSVITIMCDVVAEALNIVKGVKEKEDAGG